MGLDVDRHPLGVIMCYFRDVGLQHKRDSTWETELPVPVGWA